MVTAVEPQGMVLQEEPTSPEHLTMSVALGAFVVAEQRSRADTARGLAMPLLVQKRWQRMLEEVAPFASLPLSDATVSTTAAVRMTLEEEFERDGRWYGDVDLSLAEAIVQTISTLSVKVATLAMVAPRELGAKWRWPLRRLRVTSAFGPRVNPLTGSDQFHAGVDLDAVLGEGVAAIANGRIVFAGQFGGHGRCVEVEHGDGFRSRYSHLSQITVQLGQSVQSGQPVGLAGDSGDATGVHLHLEMRANGKLVDPVVRLTAPGGE
jgi:murein DD-endopeptidase MepM/ murein hydrolase activator NlpD